MNRLMRNALLVLPLFALSFVLAKDKPKDKATATPSSNVPAGKDAGDKEQIAAALEAMRKAKEIESQLKFQQGKIVLNDGMATLNVPPDFRYLDPPQTNKVLTDLWGNPPREKPTLGMLFPAKGAVVGPARILGAW